MRQGWTVRLAAVAAVAALLAGCTPTPPTPTPTPSPPRPSPSRPESAQAREERLAYEKAEATYVAYIGELSRLQQRGGIDGASPHLKALTAGSVLEDQTLVLKALRDDRQRTVGAVVIRSITPAGYSPKELTMHVCGDGTGVRTLDRNDKVVSRGEIGMVTVIARLVDSRWKIWSEKFAPVKQCG